MHPQVKDKLYDIFLLETKLSVLFKEASELSLALMGHSNIFITLNLYAHSSIGEIQSEMELMVAI